MRIGLQLLVPPRVHGPGRGGIPLPDAGDLRGVGVRRLLPVQGRAAHQVQTLEQTRTSFISRGIRNPGVRQCLGFCTADFWSSLAYESAEQKPKHCLTQGFLIPLFIRKREVTDLLAKFAVCLTSNGQFWSFVSSLVICCTGLSKRNCANFGELSWYFQLLADWLCIGRPHCLAALGGNSITQAFSFAPPCIRGKFMWHGGCHT